MSCPTINAAPNITSVDCQKQVRSWRLLRSLIELLIPTCNCTTFIDDQQQIKPQNNNYLRPYLNNPQLYASSNNSSAVNVITGTIFGYKRGKVSFCIQTNSKSTNPFLLLEFAVPTAVLAREMQGGILRIALECNENNNSESVLSMAAWTMYCNGRKVGYAVKRRPSKADMDALKAMSSVVVGAGMISGKELGRHDDELMYLRANFERVHGSSDSESFHLIDPEGNIGQELSIFFFRSR
ncbi:hypothetical protein COLO4_27307 [Corchorus olitorius]|uniref:Protein MIZU-KUSSEI 1-like n=1 Tax=Corchorus olitorius TaxID=93759 RepID=A0A1R3HRI1_9ROSI|nr:hypothetical protein COLO4_27307 [Corchorus olitorius]